MTTLKVFAADTLQEAKDAYQAWAGHNSDVRIIGQPMIEQISTGWKVMVLYQAAQQARQLVRSA